MYVHVHDSCATSGSERYIYALSAKSTQGAISVLQVGRRIYYAHFVSFQTSRVAQKPVPSRPAFSLRGRQPCLPLANWISSLAVMASGGLGKHATDQESLDDRTLAVPNCIELPSAPRSQLLPSGLSEDDTHGSGDEEGRSDIEEVENQWQTSSRAEYESGVEEENQEGGDKSDGANQTDRRKPESGNQDDDNEAGESNKGNTEDIYLQDRRAHYIAMMGCRPSDAERRAVQSYFATMAAQPAELIEFGDSISHYSFFPFPFSRSFLEIFTPDEVKHKIEAIEAYSNAVSELHG